MFIAELSRIIDDLKNEYSKDEWVITRLVEKYVDGMTSFEAYENIDLVLEILLQDRNRHAWTEIFAIVFSLARKSNTTEMSSKFSDSLVRMGNISEQISNYAYGQFVELSSFYRIHDFGKFSENGQAKASFEFRTATMTNTRPADYYLGCLDDSVFLDFNLNESGLVYLVRISFDGYGCCNVASSTRPMRKEESLVFVKMVEEDHIDQEVMSEIVLKTIDENRNLLWNDALREYGFVQ